MFSRLLLHTPWGKRAALRREGNRRDIVGEGNVITSSGVHMEQVTIQIRGDSNVIHIAPGCRITGVRFMLFGSGHRVEIGAGCVLGGGTFWMEDEGSVIRVGAGCTTEASTDFAATEGRSIFVGADCMFAYDIDVRTGDSHSILDTRSQCRINPAADVEIGRHVWVASHVSILKGAVIGEESVIGTRSVVTGMIPPRALAAGVPASVRKNDITWLRERVVVARQAGVEPAGAAMHLEAKK